MKPLSLLLLALAGLAACDRKAAPPVQAPPAVTPKGGAQIGDGAYKAEPGLTNPDGFPATPARLVVYRGGKEHVYTAPAGDPSFGADPRVEVWDQGPGPRVFLFQASAPAGGSGFPVHAALLQDRPEALMALMPALTLSNAAECALLRDPAHPEPVLATADFIWADGEGHYDRHRFRVSAYVSDPGTGLYARKVEYVTSRKYSTENGRVLSAESRVLMARLSGK